MTRDEFRSIRSCSRARTSSQRGFALIWAVGLAVLFFMLIELMLIDSARELAEARRFRARIVAQTLAENGAELAAAQLLSQTYADVGAEDWQGKITGRMTRDTSGRFVIEGTGETKGTDPSKARVELIGTASAGSIDIDSAIHTP